MKFLKKLTFEIKSDGLQNVISSLKEVSEGTAQTLIVLIPTVL